MIELFYFVIILVIAIIISSLPLYFSVIIMGGKASILRVFFTNILVAGVTGLAVHFYGLGTLPILLITILLYSFIFKLGFIKSFLAWIIQYIVAAMLVILSLLILGVTL